MRGPVHGDVVATAPGCPAPAASRFDPEARHRYRVQHVTGQARRFFAPGDIVRAAVLSPAHAFDVLDAAGNPVGRVHLRYVNTALDGR